MCVERMHVFQAIIIARYSGAISVCSVANLQNLLGDSPEFLAGPPQVSSLCSDQGFLALECETKHTSKKSLWDGQIAQSEIVSNTVFLIAYYAFYNHVVTFCCLSVCSFLMLMSDDFDFRCLKSVFYYQNKI
jgi:hypothetical protein